MTRYVFITGGVVSSLGKGITAASLGRLLKSRGLQVVIQKLDPYINVDPGTMNPFQHGEVFVTDDGGETDLDLGHYERFTGEHLRQLSNVTAGSVYLAVIRKERRGAYLGDTVQVIPHITNEIKSRIRRLGEESNADVVITEVGGTVGDIESLPFLEAIRQLGKEIGPRNIAYIHVTLAPFLKTSEEIKTKPTQHSVAELRSKGISPDVIVVRSEQAIDESIRQKISLFCDVPPEAVISASDTDNIYRMPLLLHEEGLDDVICRRLSLHTLTPTLDRWREMLDRMDSADNPVRVGMVGKYVDLPDAYASVVEALHHAAAAVGRKLEIEWILSENLTGMLVPGVLADLDGIVVPGGFGGKGDRGEDLGDRLRPPGGGPLPGPVPGSAVRGDRVRPQPPETGPRQQHRVRCRDSSRGDRPDAQPGRSGGQGRDHAAGSVSGQPHQGIVGARSLRVGPCVRAASASLGGEPALSEGPCRGGNGAVGSVSRWGAG